MISADTLNVITTRPNNRATNLLRAISRLTSDDKVIHAHHAPLIDISSYHDDMFFKELDQVSEDSAKHLLSYHGVIFISGNAVDWAQRSLPVNLWQSIISNPVFAIGEQTAAILQAEITRANDQSNTDSTKIDQQVIHPQQMNSEGLLKLPELKQVKGQQWLIVKGKDGRDKLKTGLQVAGARVQELSVYQRQLPNSAAQSKLIELQSLDPIWLISSVQALENLQQVLNHQVQDCRIIISSDRIAEQASQMGFSIMAQAKDASDKQLVQSLKEYIGK